MREDPFERIRIPKNKELFKKYAQAVKEIFPGEWVAKQLNVMNEKSLLKEFSAALNLTHPFITNYVNMKASLRRAEIFKQKIVMVEVGLHNIQELGRNLYELKGSYDIKKIRPRLQDKNLYEAVCWEFETAINLKYSGCQVEFVKETNEHSYDIHAKYMNEEIAIECKTKQIEDYNHKKNQSFAMFLGQKVLDRLKEIKESYDIRITVKNTGQIEDVKPLSLLIRQMISENKKTALYKDEYTIEFIEDYKGVAIPWITQNQLEDVCINRTEESDLRCAFSNEGTKFKNRIFFRFPPESYEVKNIDDLISEANKQIKGIQGCVFLKVPFHSFEQSVIMIEKILHKRFENVGAIKIVALNKSYDQTFGVKTERKEKWISNSYAMIPISDELKECLSKNLFLNKYKDYFKYRKNNDHPWSSGCDHSI